MKPDDIHLQESLLADTEPAAEGGEMGYDPRLELARTWQGWPGEDAPGSRGVAHRVSVDVSRRAGRAGEGIEAETFPISWRQTHG